MGAPRVVCRWLSDTCPLWRPWPGRGQPEPGASPLAQQGRCHWPSWEAPLLEPGGIRLGGSPPDLHPPTPPGLSPLSPWGPPRTRRGVCGLCSSCPHPVWEQAGWCHFHVLSPSGSSLVDGARLPGRRQLWAIAWGALQPSIREDPEGALSACPLQTQRVGGTDLPGMVPGVLSPPAQQVGVEPGVEEQVWAERRAWDPLALLQGHAQSPPGPPEDPTEGHLPGSAGGAGP